MKSERVEFKPPKEFKLPEGTSAGQEFDLVCTFKVKKDGTLCLTELGDFDMPGYDDKDEESSRPQYGQAKEMMTAGMPPEGG